MNVLRLLTSAQLKQAIDLREQIEVLEQKLAALTPGLMSEVPVAAKRGRPKKVVEPALLAQPAKKKRKMSAAARAKIGAAQKARWAKLSEAKKP